MIGVWNFFRPVSYRVGRGIFSLDDVEHELLRANRRRQLPPPRPFGAGDPRPALAVTPPDPRYRFAAPCAAVTAYRRTLR